MIGAFDATTPKLRRNRAMIAVLIGCGLRRAEVAALKLEGIQLREGHWVIADLHGKGGHIRTVPMPYWVKRAIDAESSQTKSLRLRRRARRILQPCFPERRGH